MEINSEVTITVTAEDIKQILREWFNQPNAEVNFNLGSESMPSADFRDSQFRKVFSSAELVYKVPVINRKSNNSSYPDSFGVEFRPG